MRLGRLARAAFLVAVLTGSTGQSFAEPPELLLQVHRSVMAEARYVPDPPGQDIWRASVVGDCEDLALEMARRLERAGLQASAMRIVVFWHEQQDDWHAALLVRAGRSAWSLDSLERLPQLWDGKGIEFEVGVRGRRIVAINGMPIRPGAWKR